MDKADMDTTDTLDKTDNIDDCHTYSIGIGRPRMSEKTEEEATEPACGKGDGTSHTLDPPQHPRRGQRERKSPRKFKDFVIF